MKRVIFTGLYLLGSLVVHSQQISFYREDLVFRIENDTFFVSGNYYLKEEQKDENRTALFYELPSDSIFVPVDSVFIYNITSNKKIKDIKITEGGVLFPVTLHSRTTLFISYCQKLKSNRAKYILTTTRYWRKPLEEVTYKLIVPAELEILHFSYHPDKMEIIGDKKLYYWKKNNFMPAKDMEFEFK